MHHDHGLDKVADIKSFNGIVELLVDGLSPALCYALRPGVKPDHSLLCLIFTHHAFTVGPLNIKE
jgi:hypothetical protein